MRANKLEATVGKLGGHQRPLLIFKDDLVYKRDNQGLLSSL